MRKLLGGILITVLLYGEETTWLTKEPIEDNVYTRNCVSCHEYMPASLERMFMSYLKVYSGEFTLKESLKAYLRNPDKEMSVMSDLFLDRFGIKSSTDLSEAELEEAVNIYWDKYNVRNKLK